MKIVKIRNRYIYHGDNTNGYHYYGLFWNPRYRKYNAIRLTHIANKDHIRYQQADNGIIKPIRLKQIDKYTDSGITRERYINDVNGNNITLDICEVVVPKVSGSSTMKILSHGTRLYSRGFRR